MVAYLTVMAISAGIYALLALGVNLTWGMAGMINLGLAGFFAVGGYTTALLTKSGVPIPLGVGAGALAAAATGAGVALITARLRADYLAIVTLGFSESVRIAAANEIWLTNGSDGIAGIPGPWRGTVSAAAVQSRVPGHRRRGADRDVRAVAAPGAVTVRSCAARDPRR